MRVCTPLRHQRLTLVATVDIERVPMSALAAHERSPFWLRARAVWANDASTATRARNGRLFEEHDVVYRRWWAERENNRAARDENSRAFLTLDAGHTSLNQLPVGDFKVCMHRCVCHMRCTRGRLREPLETRP